MKLLLSIALVIGSLSAVAFPPGYATNVAKVKDDPNAHFSGTVKEVKITKSYVYAKIQGKTTTKWIATSPTKLLKGDKVEFVNGPAMKDFHSKALDRTFKEIYFTSYVKVTGRSVKLKSTVKKGSIKKANHLISDIFKNSKKLENKEVKIRAKVVKASNGIMKRNWLHIQDGTDYKGMFDLVVTTDQKAKVGDTVVITAKVTLNKDFGYGYKYPVLLEKAKVSK